MWEVGGKAGDVGAELGGERGFRGTRAADFGEHISGGPGLKGAEDMGRLILDNGTVETGCQRSLLTLAPHEHEGQPPSHARAFRQCCFPCGQLKNF